jgi:hypothetical protein
MRDVIGIDPGFSGGIALVSGHGSLQSWPMPVMKVGTTHAIDEDGIVNLLNSMNEYISPRPVVYIEHVGVMPKQGVVSSGRFMESWGLVRGLLRGLGYERVLVRPQAWQRVVLAGHPKGSELAVASARWPGHKWIADGCRKPHDGMIDAALIALYGHMQECGNHA